MAARWGQFRGARRDGAKYNNRPTRCAQGVMHHSGKEARRCDELHVLQSGGLISGLEAHPQPRWDIEINGIHVTRYIADFAYIEDGKPVREDVKGMVTAEYRLKERLMLAVYGIEIRRT